MEDQQYIQENYDTLHGWLVGDDILNAQGLSQVMNDLDEYEIDRTLAALADTEFPVYRMGFGDGGRNYDTSEFDNSSHREVVKHFFPDEG